MPRPQLFVMFQQDDYVSLDYKKVIASRNFANKIWQSARYVLGVVDAAIAANRELWTAEETLLRLNLFPDYTQLSLSHRYILHHLHATIIIVEQSLKDSTWRYAADALSEFWQTRFCDVFLEYRYIL